MSTQRDNAACLESLELFLENVIQAPIIEGLLSIREQADDIVQNNTAQEMTSEDVMRQLLREVKSWTQVLLDEEVRRIHSKIAYLQKLLTAMFVMKVKVLSCINMRKDNGDFPLTIPSNSTFIHQSYINCANVMLDNPYVLEEMKIVDLRPLVAEGIRKACFACIEWADLLEWGLDGVDVNDIIREATRHDAADGNENEDGGEGKGWVDDSNDNDEFHDLANDVKMNDNDDDDDGNNGIDTNNGNDGNDGNDDTSYNTNNGSDNNGSDNNYGDNNDGENSGNNGVDDRGSSFDNDDMSSISGQSTTSASNPAPATKPQDTRTIESSSPSFF